MNRSIKAVLLAALVFPGAGHIYLRRHLTGAILAGIALTSLFFVVTRTVDVALQISGQIQQGAVPPDIAAITDLIAQQTSGPETRSLSIAATALLGAWIIGILDAYRIGRRLE